MEDVFISILNMSITASYFALAIILVRIFFRKLPKWISCILWGLVGIRLILPFSFESILSLIPSSETIPHDIMYQSEPHITSGIPYINSALNPIISESFTPKPYYSMNPLQGITFIAAVIWLIGTSLMLLYTAVSFILLKRKTRESIKTENGIYICDRIDTPFILGLIKPKIFIPSSIVDNECEFIISHERAHIKRLDHIWKPLGFLILSVYWFNPLMWIAYILLCRDIEAACDERVLKNGDAEMKKSYSEALINCSAPKHLITACPLAFGETGVKQRIKSILSYKKPTLWIIITALIISLVLSVCFMTNPDGMKIDDIKGFEGIFSDVEKIQIFIGNGHIYTTEDTKPDLSEIKKVRIEKTPTDDYFTPAYRIEIDDEITINIDESFSRLYLQKNNGIIYPNISTYSIKNSEVLKKFFSISNYVTGMEGIYVNIGEIEETESGLNFKVTWHNERDIDVEYGELYNLERFTEEKIYEDVPFPEDFVFLLPAYLLKSRTSAEKSYYCPMKLSDGEYRFTTTFRTADGKTYEAKTVFFIGENPVNAKEKKSLTLDDVISLSKKGKALSWADLESYSYYDISFGFHERKYVIDDMFSLVAAALKYGDSFTYVRLTANDIDCSYIDIFSDGLESFINTHKNGIPLKIVSDYSTLSFAVDSTGLNFDSFIEYGATFGKLHESHTKHLPTIKIESRAELERFYQSFKDKMNFDSRDTYNSNGISFNELYSNYKNQYVDLFETHTVFITYATANNSTALFNTNAVAISGDTLSILINESKGTGDDVVIGHIIVTEIKNNNLINVSNVDSFIAIPISETAE